MTHQTTRNEFLDFCKGLLIFLVCIGHVLQYISYSGTGYWDDPLFKAIYIFHMPLFMAIAGYLSYSSIQRRSFFDLIPERSINYILPIIVWSTTYCIIKFAAQTYASPMGFVDDIIFKSLNSFWFLTGLFISIVIVKIASLFKRYAPVVTAVLFGGMLLLPDTYDLYLYKFIFPFFYIGYVLAHKKITIPTSSAFVAKVLMVSGAASLIVFLMWDQSTYIYVSKMALTQDNIPNIIGRYIGSVIVSVFMLFAFLVCYNKCPAGLRKGTITMGIGSIFVYILSTYVFIAADMVSNKINMPAMPTFTLDITGIIIGLLIAIICLYLGRIGLKIPIIALLFFGKKTKV